MDRKLLLDLNEWLAQPSKKPLIIRGARQVGKSYLVRDFCRKKQLELLEINFEQKPEMGKIFQTNEPLEILKNLEIHFNKEISEKSSLLFLDEIQNSPEVISCLRYFYEQMPSFPIIAAGSLFEFAFIEKEFSVPVGRIEYRYLGPMTFKEYLKGRGEDKLIQFMGEISVNEIQQKKYPFILHEKLIKELRVYFLLGGMPEVLQSYIQNDSLLKCEIIQSSILKTYEDDFHKYRKRMPFERLKLLFQNAPIQIGEKFKYSGVSKTEKAAVLSSALNLLSQSKVIYKLFHSDSSGLPLRAQIKENYFKLLFLDVGLLNQTLGVRHTEIMSGKDLNALVKGALAEQFVGQHLLYRRQAYEEPELFMWAREKAQSSAEVDYVIEVNGQPVPIEVKAGSTGRLKSLQIFLWEKQLDLGLRLNDAPPSYGKFNLTLQGQTEHQYRLLSLPLYLVEEAPRLLSSF